MSRLGYCRAMVKRVFLFSGIAVCLFAVGFWYFVASLSAVWTARADVATFPRRHGSIRMPSPTLCRSYA